MNRFQRTACWMSGVPVDLDVAALPERVEPLALQLRAARSTPDLEHAVEQPLAAVDELARRARCARCGTPRASSASSARPPWPAPGRRSSRCRARSRARMCTSFSVSMMWSAITDSVMWECGDAVAEHGCGRPAASTRRGCSTRSAMRSARRGSKPSGPSVAGVVRPNSSSPSCRLRIWLESTTGGVRVLDGDLERHHREVPLDEGDHPVGPDAHPLAGRGEPQQLAAQHAVAEVELALERQQLGDVEHQRLVVDVEPDDLRVGDVDDRLPDLGEAVRLLGVPDRPDLVEPVDEGAVLVGVAALRAVAAHARGTRWRS